MSYWRPSGGREDELRSNPSADVDEVDFPVDPRSVSHRCVFASAPLLSKTNTTVGSGRFKPDLRERKNFMLARFAPTSSVAFPSHLRCASADPCRPQFFPPGGGTITLYRAAGAEETRPPAQLT